MSAYSGHVLKIFIHYTKKMHQKLRNIEENNITNVYYRKLKYQSVVSFDESNLISRHIMMVFVPK